MTHAHTASPLDAVDAREAMTMLRQQGIRISAARRLVIETLYEADTPVAADEIAAGLGGRLPGSDLASVYRNLETLERAGLVRHFHVGHGPGLYGLAGHERGEYLVCESCAKVLEAGEGALEPARELIRERFGFEASFSHFPIVGRCERCAREQSTSTTRTPRR